MIYGNKSFQYINESEKKYILGLHKKMDFKNIFEVKNKTDIQELISDFGKSLESQKKYLSALFTNLPVDESYLILNNVKENCVQNLFGENKVVLENYYTFYNYLLTEQSLDPISELDRFHKFLNDSVSIELDRIDEQMWDYIQSAASQASDYISQGASSIYDAGAKLADASLQWLNKATNYISEMGVNSFMESIRSALFSAPGTAIQIIVSLTGPATAGIGPAILTGIWCIMGLYDLYQIIQGVEGAWANFIIDVICALTAGSLGGVLSKFVGTAGKTISQTIQNLVLKGLGPYIIPVIVVIQKSISTVAKWFTWAGQFSKANLGMGWLSDKVAPAIKYMSEIVEGLVAKIKPDQAITPGITTPLGKSVYVTGKALSSLVPRTANLRVANVLSQKMNPEVWTKLANLTSHDIGLYAGQVLEKGTFKAIQKFMEEEFKEKPVSLALEFIDKEFGSAYSDAYLAYLGGKKMFKYQSGKLVSAVENVANTLKPNVNDPSSISNPLEYGSRQAQRITQGIGSSETEKDYSSGLVSSILQIPGKSTVSK